MKGDGSIKNILKINNFNHKDKKVDEAKIVELVKGTINENENENENKNDDIK